MRQTAKSADWIRERAARVLRAGLLRLALAAAIACSAGAEIIDSVVAVVGNSAVTESDVTLQLKLQDLIGLQPAGRDHSAAERREALNRLVERELVRREMEVVNFRATGENEIAAEVEQLRQQRFWDGLDFAAALQAYGLREQDVREFLQEKTSVLDFLDFRFKTGLQVSSDEIEAYYADVYAPEFQRVNNEAPPPLEQVSDQIEGIVREKEVGPLVDEWLNELRVRARVAFVEDAPLSRADAPE